MVEEIPAKTARQRGVIGVDSWASIISVYGLPFRCSNSVRSRLLSLQAMRKEKIEMKVADMRPFRKVLEQLRGRLRGDVSTMADAALGTGSTRDHGSSSTKPAHMDDLGAEAFDQEFTLSLMENEEDTLQMIDEALARIRQKTFGSCVECDGIITKKRLEALPYAPTCIRCAEKLEKERW